jgi:hypothetical protein
MHVLQQIAIQAEDKDEAYRRVEDYLQGHLRSDEFPSDVWYDWFVVGGGRFNVEEGDDFAEAYTHGKTNLILSVKEEPDLFDERVLQSMENRKEEFDRYAKDVDSSAIDKIITDYNPRDHNFLSFQSLYPIKKLIDMAYGTWDFNSYFFDMENDTTTPKYLFESIDKGQDNWYLVPVDFHF